MDLKEYLNDIKTTLDEYKNVTPQQLYTKCIEEKLNTALTSYLKYLDNEWAILYYNSDEGIRESNCLSKTYIYGSIEKQARYNLSDILLFKYKLEETKKKIAEEQKKGKKKPRTCDEGRVVNNE